MRSRRSRGVSVVTERADTPALSPAPTRADGSWRILFNVVQSQTGWFACVLSATAGRAWIGITVAMVLIGLHLVITARQPREVLLVLAAAAIGTATDTTLVQIGVVSFADHGATGFTTPWMISLWMLFATTLCHSLAWLQGRVWLAVLLGAAAGPLSYTAGAALGALQIQDHWYAYAAIGALWAIALPTLVAIAHWPERARALASEGAERGVHS